MALFSAEYVPFSILDTVLCYSHNEANSDNYISFKIKGKINMKHKTGISISVLFLIILTFLTACTPPTPPTRSVAQPPPQTDIIRIGMSASYPPMTFALNGKVQGVEADFARKLPAELGKAVKISVIPWDQLIDALITKKIDIIMSGMTITKPRQVRIAFTRPYLTTGLMTAFRLEDVKKYPSITAVKKSNASIGVVRNTTAERFVRENFPFASRIVLLNLPYEAVGELRGRNIDLFVHDAPSIMWLVSENEAYITGLWRPLNTEQLAWGVRKEDTELRNQLNSVLAKWKKDGTLDAILDRWLPFRPK